MVEIIPPAIMSEYTEHTAPILNSTPAIPDFVTQTKEYLKQHPEMIREVAGDEIQQLEAWLDTIPGLGGILKAKLNKFLEGAGTQTDTQRNVKDTPGTTFIPPGRQREGEEQGIEQEEIMTTQDQRDLLEYISELSEEGFSLPEIADAVWRDYRIEYHPLKIKRMLKSYYGRPEPDDDEKNEDKRVFGGSLRMYQKLLERNGELQKKVAELMAKLPPEVANSVRRGIIRRFLGWLW